MKNEKKVELGDNWISLYIKNGNFKNEKSRHKKKKVKKKFSINLTFFSVPHYNNANFTQMDHDYTKVQNI